MENKKNKLLILLITLCVLVPVGGAVAYFRAETSSRNKLSSGNVGIELMDTTSEGDAIQSEEGIDFTFAYPGAVKEKETFVQNISDNDLYTRITVTKYWIDEEGNKVIDADPKLIEVVTNDTSNWIIQDSDENDEIVYFYFRKPLSPQEATDLFINRIKLSGKITNDGEIEYSELSAHLSFEADAVQKLGAQQAMMSEWGLDVIIDSNDVVQHVEE